MILRFLRFRPGDASECDGLGGTDKNNIIVDHCSVSWSVDECLSVYGNKNSTVQWCIAAQALHTSVHEKGAHCYGGNWGGTYASYHHNLIAHCKSRTPRLGPRPSTQLNEYVDIRNNVFYNWNGEGCYGGENMHVNIVNNYYKPGPATKGNRQYRIAKIGVRTEEYVTDDDGTYNDWYPSLHKWGTFYVTGNKVEGHSDVTADNWTKGIYEQQNGKDVDNLWTEETKAAIRSNAEVVDGSNVTTQTADDAYNSVLAYVGACNYRDALDELILGDVRNKKATCTAEGNEDGYINKPEEVAGAIEVDATNYPILNTDANRSVTDTDGDGMPDAFETEYNLDPNDATDGNEKTLDPGKQYTNLEMYLHHLVKDIMVVNG